MPAPIDAGTAQAYLAELVVKVPSNDPPYNRKLFPHWITISGECNTREIVLIRDGTNVVTNPACSSTSGTWYSEYDGATWGAALDLDIDHVVPLKEAWVSGAHSWSTERRRALANDLDRPQLIAVTDNVNQSKGDKDPAVWMPPLQSYYCTYIRAWIEVKHFYELSVDPAEKAALTNYLDGDGKADTLGALKHALKALGVATMLVGLGAGTVFAGVTLGLGITTISEFQTLMRSIVRSSFPQLHAQLHSVSDPATSQYYRTEIWERERVEQALEEALEKGGWKGWMEEARKQLERERAINCDSLAQPKYDTTRQPPEQYPTERHSDHLGQSSKASAAGAFPSPDVYCKAHQAYQSGRKAVR
ncbi:hypothetical protein FRC07_007651 [Ceratobasidium sp. 392]|nr:hypothetical protein FRC07_007651 [Ceratobasidium sp. 392]